jgi:hypothetical protein
MAPNTPSLATLDELIDKAKAWWDNATPEDREAMIAVQRASWLRAEMNWPKAKFQWIDGVKVYNSYEDYCND